MASSQYIPTDQDFLFIEFIYNSKVINTADSAFLRIKNFKNGSLNYLSFNQNNYQKAIDLTGNTLDVHVQPISSDKFVHFDIDRPISYFEKNLDTIYFEFLTKDLNGLSRDFDVEYHTLKLHILQGYTFSDIAGLVARISYSDDKKNYVFVANTAYLKEDNIQYNKRPFRIVDKVYDRYIEISFPTIKSLKEVDINIPDADLTVIPPTKSLKEDDYLYYNANSSIKGQFPDVDRAKINLLLYKVEDVVTSSTGLLILDSIIDVSDKGYGVFSKDLNTSDVYEKLTAFIKESDKGDYFELFPMYDGNFIEDYIIERRQLFGEDYSIIHDVDVFEQLYDSYGYNEIRTHTFTQVQESNFDKPFKFRPIIENANCISYTIEYTMRLFMKNSPSYIIRRSSISSKNSKKYGRYLNKLNIPVGFKPLKIYNKIIKETHENLLAPENLKYLSRAAGGGELGGETIKTQNIYIPLDNLNIVINSKTVIYNSVSQTIEDMDTSKGLSSIQKGDVVYGQGDGIIYINEFDNFLKFKLFSYTDGQIKIADAYNKYSYINLVFELSTGEKIKIKPFTLVTNIVNGEVVFKLDSDVSSKILKSSVNTFWLTIENYNETLVDGTVTAKVKNFEVTLYTGKWSNMNTITSISEIDFTYKYNLLNEKLNQIKYNLSELKTAYNKYVDLSKTIPVSEMNNSVDIQSLISSVTELIQKSSIIE